MSILHTNLNTNKRNSKINIKFKLFIFGTFVLAALVLAARLFAANTINWSFDTALDYQLSDTNKIELASSEVKLKQVETTILDDTQSEFDSGTYSNIQYTNDVLVLGSTPQHNLASSEGLISQWRFENNTNDSASTNNGNLVGSPIYQTNGNQKVGNYSLVFNGSTDRFQVPNNASLQITTGSISAWVKVGGTDSTLFPLVVSKGTTNTAYALQMDSDDKPIWRVRVGGSTYDAKDTSTIVKRNTWEHWTGTYDGETMHFYRDGKLVASNTTPSGAISQNTGDLYIGDGLEGTNKFTGGLDEIEVYSKVLTESEVFENYLNGLGQYGEYQSKITDLQYSDNDLQDFSWAPTYPYRKELRNALGTDSGYPNGNISMASTKTLYHFNNNFSDSSGGNFGGTQIGTVGFTSNGLFGSHAAQFTGAGNLRVSSSGRTTGNQITIAAWVKPTNASTIYSSDGSMAIAIRYSNTTEKFSFAIRTVNNAQQTLESTVTAKAGEWHFIVWHYNGSTFSAYVDNQLGISVPKTGNVSLQATNVDHVIGAYCYNDNGTCNGHLIGAIDEFVMFNRALTTQELTDLYNRGANEVKYQLRTCDDDACDGESFIGPDGTSNTYYSELNNAADTPPSYDISAFTNNRYLQYRTVLSSLSSTLKPEITSTSTVYTGYAQDKPSVNLSTQYEFEAIPASIVRFCEGTLDIDNNCTVNSVKPINTEIYHQLCNDTLLNCNTNNTWKYWDGNSWENATSSQYNTAADINTNIQLFVPQTKYFVFRSFLSGGGQSTPVLKDISISVEVDTTAPVTNASNAAVSGKNSGDWINTKPTIGWTAGADNDEGIGLLGYCIALDESNIDTTQNLNPAISGGLLHSLNDGLVQTYCPYIVTGNSIDLNSISGLTLQTNKEYNFSIKAVDNSGNIWNGSSEDYQDLFTFRYDGTTPTNPAFISMPSNFVQSKDVTITWPTDPTNGAGDVGAGLAGLQYRIGSGGTWYGDLHNGNQDLTDLLVNDGAYTTSEEFDYPNLIDGSNIIYFRAIDNAGNVASSSVTGALKINSTAPGQVQNLQVTPADSTTNSYGFSWDIPDTFIGEASGLAYCYTVNTLPNANNCTYTQAGVTSIPADAYASQPGTNNFYIVARDEASNINYATYTSVQFTYSGEAPGIPLNFDVSDLSVKETEDWKLAVTWAPPTNVGAGVSNYKVFRSSNAGASCNVSMLNFTQVSTVLGTSYIDTNLEQQDYYYCVKACDSANNCSAPSSTDVQYPTGKFTEPAALISGPTVNTVTTKKAVITWVTDRRSDSKIQIGLGTNDYFEAESAVSAQVTAHTVTLDNLVAGTTYYYRAKWTDEDGNTGISEEKSFTTSPPPSIVMTNVVNIGIDSALLQLRVSGTTNATILYGINNSFNSIKELSTSFTESTYTVPLDGLVDNSRYTYKIVLKDIEGAEYLNLETNEFTTLPRPVVSNISVEEIKNVAQPTVKVNWNSNTEISSIVNFFPESNPTSVQDSVILDRVTTHEVILSGLLANTRYVLIVKGIDRFGNEAVSSPQVITTATDSRPPEISNIKVETVNPDSLENTSQIIVSWETDEVSTSQVEYGEGTTGSYSQTTQVDRNYGYRHVVIITNLKPASVFHLRAISQDNSKNTSESMNIVTITPKQQENAFDIVLKGLGDIFSFL